MKIENEVAYRDANSKLIDLLVQIDGRKVGVSVTRAYNYQAEFSLDEAERILTKKLAGLSQSRESAAEEDCWERSMLFIVAVDEAAADQMEKAFALASPEDKSDVIVMMTVSEGNDGFLYNLSE